MNLALLVHIKLRWGSAMYFRTAFLFVMSFFWLTVLEDAVWGAEPHPNIVLIYADDLGYGDVGFNGRRDWATPNLDRLATQGAIFKRFYASAVVCAPSRASMLTGKAPIHCGVSRNDDDLPAEEVTIAEALKARGYTTALFGKWHHGKPRSAASYVHPLDQGFDEFFGFTDAYHAFEKFPKTLWNGRVREPVSGYADDLFASKAVEFIRRHHDRDRPFFLYVPLTAPHFNIEAPEDEVSLHRDKFSESEANASRPLKATYAAMVTRLDRNVGQILAALDDLGLSQNTLVVFTSDHGATFEAGNRGTSASLDSNRPFRGQKRTVWEGGIRVPTVVRWPGKIAAGTVSHEVMQMIDLFPTFLSAAGGTPDLSWQIDGTNLVPAWTGQMRLAARTIFWEWRGEGANQVCAMRGDLKLVVQYGGKPELYDLSRDPQERIDIASNDPDLCEELRDQIEAWLATETRR